MRLRYIGWTLVWGLLLGIVGIITGGTHNPYNALIMAAGGAVFSAVGVWLYPAGSEARR